jgi:hypothetical protein
MLRPLAAKVLAPKALARQPSKVAQQQQCCQEAMASLVVPTTLQVPWVVEEEARSADRNLQAVPLSGEVCQQCFAESSKQQEQQR